MPASMQRERAPVMSQTAKTPLTVIEDEETGNRFVAYTTPAGMALDCRFDGEAPWFTQRDLAAMFGVDVRTANEHIANFLKTGEIAEPTIRNFRIVRDEGNRQVSREVNHYSLDVAFYVGYRVNSKEGALFRRWATDMLIQIATKGFVVDKRRHVARSSGRGPKPDIRQQDHVRSA
jgi:hypothetical protein